MAIVGSAQVLVRPTFKGFQKDVQKELGGVGEAAGKSAGLTTGKVFGATFAANIATKAVTAAGELMGKAFSSGFGRLTAIENAQAKMRGLGHDADAVRQIMDNALTSVKGTAFGLGEAATIAASAVAAGITPGEKLATHLTRVANNAAAAGISMEEMGGIFNRAATQANGVQNDVISQLADRGIPIYQALAEEMGVTAGEVFKLASQGKVDFETFSTAAEKAAGTVASEMGGTVTGAWQNMWAAVGRIGANALSGIFPMIAPALQGVMDALAPLEEKAKVVGAALGDWLARGAAGVKTFIAEWKAGEGLGGQVAEWVGRIKDGAQGLFDLLVRGDYTGAFRNAFGWEEDSQAVDVLFRLRDAVIDLGGWIKGTLVPAAKDFGGWLKDHKGVVVGIVAAYVGLRGVMAAHTAAMAVQKAGGFVAWLKDYAGKINIVKTATKAWTAVTWLAQVAMKAFNAVIRMNPIGLIITGLMLLAAGLVLAYKKSETFRNIVNGAWEGIKNAASAVVDWFTGTALPFLQGVWDGIAAGATWLWDNILSPVWTAIKAGFDAVVAGISWAWNNVLKPAWDAVSAAATWLWGVLSPIFSAIWTAWSTMAKFIFDVWVNVLKFAWDALAFAAEWLWKSVLSPIFGWIGARWNDVLTGMKVVWERVLKPAWDAVSAAASWLWNRVLKPAFDGIKRAWDAMVNGIVGFWDTKLKPMFQAVVGFVTETVVPKIKSAWDGLKSAFSAVWDWIKTNVFDNFKKGLDKVVDWVGDGVERVGRGWKKIANLLRDPINWVINFVWNDGLKSAFDNVAKAIGSDARLPKAPTIPAFAKGGLHRGGWALVGEEGPELINTSNPARVYTAAQTQAMLGGAGEGSEGGSVGSVASAAVDWIRGGLANAAGLILNPLKSLISSTVSQWGSVGGLAGSVGTNAIDKLLSWIRGKDDEAPSVMSGGWVRPANGPITQRFGVPGVLSGIRHAGIDIGGSMATYAAAAGQVLKTGWNILGGRSGIGILLQHAKDLFTYYGHNPVGGVQVRAGQSVKAGQRIGRGGSTGNVTGDHLHFEVHEGGIGRAVNPSKLGVFDQGGFLAPGALGTNLTRKPEPVLTGQQWSDIHTLALGNTARGQRLEVTVHATSDDLAMKVGRQTAQRVGDAIRSKVRV